MTHPAPLRVALLGYGLGGRVFHAPWISATPGLRLDAVVTSRPEYVARAERELPGVRVLARAERLWDDAGAYDLVVVSTPNATHAPLALAALSAGLHVVVDKPFAASLAQGRAVEQAARRAGRLALPFHNRRWDGDFQTVRHLVADGSLGTLFRFESRFERWRAATKPRWAEPNARAAGEGLLFDLGPHLVDQALVLCGPVTHVYAELDRRLPGTVTEDDVTVLLTHASGARSRLVMSSVAAQSGPRFAVYGSGGTYLKYGLDPQEHALLAALGGALGGADAVDVRALLGAAQWGAEPAERWGTLGTRDGVRPVPTRAGDYGQFWAGVVAAIRDGAPPPVSVDDALAGLDVLERAAAVAR